MNWVSIASNFASAIIGAIVGGMLTAYAIGRWRGEIEQRLAAMSDWRALVDNRLERGQDKLVNVQVIESKLDEMIRLDEVGRREARESMAELHTRVTAVRESLESKLGSYVSRSECERQHKRRAS